MNTYTKQIQNHDAPPRVSAGNKTSRAEYSYFRVIFLLGCICLIFFCAIALRVFLTAKIERMNKQVARINTQIREYEYQCYHLRNKKASLTSLNYISSKVHQYSLKLRPADYRQVRTVALLKEDGSISSGSTTFGTRTYSAAGKRPQIRYAGYRRTDPPSSLQQNRR